MNQKNTHVLFGVISGIIMVIVILALYLAGPGVNTNMQLLAYIPLLGIIVNGLFFSKVNDGNVTFKTVFGSCFKVAMIICLMVILYSVISFYVFPEMKIKALEAMRLQPAEGQGMTQAQKEKSIALMQKYYGTIMVSYTTLPILVWGVLLSLVGAAVAKKNK